MFALRYLQLHLEAHICIYEKRSTPISAKKYATHTDEAVDFNAFGIGIGGRARSLVSKIPGLMEADK